MSILNPHPQELQLLVMFFKNHSVFTYPCLGIRLLPLFVLQSVVFNLPVEIAHYQLLIKVIASVPTIFKKLYLTQISTPR